MDSVSANFSSCLWRGQGVEETNKSHLKPTLPGAGGQLIQVALAILLTVVVVVVTMTALKFTAELLIIPVLIGVLAVLGMGTRYVRPSNGWDWGGGYSRPPAASIWPFGGGGGYSRPPAASIWPSFGGGRPVPVASNWFGGGGYAPSQPYVDNSGRQLLGVGPRR